MNKRISLWLPGSAIPGYTYKTDIDACKSAGLYKKQTYKDFEKQHFIVSHTVSKTSVYAPILLLCLFRQVYRKLGKKIFYLH
jgi:hypothetical protein